MNKRIYISLAISALAACSFAENNVMVDDGQPWGTADNVNAMDANFGGNWSQTNSTAPATSVFNSSNSFVWLLFSANSDGNGQAYMAANDGLINSWVAGGGHLFYMSAPWDYSATTLLPGGETESFSNSFSLASYSGNFTGAFGDSALENGPFGNASGTWNGTYFSHAVLSGPATSLMTGVNGTVVARQGYGLGTMTYATWTDPDFWYGPTSGQTLLNNAVAMAASPVPEPAPCAIFGLGVLGLAIRRRKNAR